MTEDTKTKSGLESLLTAPIDEDGYRLEVFDTNSTNLGVIVIKTRDTTDLFIYLEGKEEPIRLRLSELRVDWNEDDAAYDVYLDNQLAYWIARQYTHD